MTRRPYLPGITLQALALSFHGRLNRSSASLCHALELYGFAMQTVRKDMLASTSTASLVSSIIHMVLYEVFNPICLYTFMDS